MTPHTSQYAPPDTFQSVPLEDLYPLGRVAADPSLTSYANSEGYVVEVLPATGGMDFEGMAGVVFFVGVIVVFVILASGIGGRG